jgi:hypothetical protein
MAAAAVVVPRHPSSPYNRHPHVAVNRPISSTSNAQSRTRPIDDFYGHEQTARICARYINNLFHCPDQQPPPPASSPPKDLPRFIAYALHRTRLTPSVTFAALYLLQRLKSRFTEATGSSGHRLFIAAFMIASKVICDDTYSNKSWCIVGQGMFALREINQMEREMCAYLEWQLNVEPKALKTFENLVRKDFKGSGPYPAPYDLPAPSSGPFAHPKPVVDQKQAGLTAIPSFGPGAPAPSNCPIPSEKSSRRSRADQATADHLPTPPASHSDVSSPTNSMSPATPPNRGPPTHIKIVSSAGSNTMPIPGENVSPPYTHVHARKPSPPVPSHHKKSFPIDTKHFLPNKTSNAHHHAAPGKSNSVYAFARPCVW